MLRVVVGPLSVVLFGVACSGESGGADGTTGALGASGAAGESGAVPAPTQPEPTAAGGAAGSPAMEGPGVGVGGTPTDPSAAGAAGGTAPVAAAGAGGEPSMPGTVQPNDAPAGSPVAEHGRLSAVGNQIVGEHGNPVQVKGMSLYWSQRDEGARYFSQGTIDWLAQDWHAGIVRAAIAVTGEGDGDYLSNRDGQLALLDNVVQAAVDNGIYVLIDWHDHHAHHHQEQAQDFFGTVAQAYGDLPNVLYEIWNEPRGDGDSGPGATWNGDIKPYAETISATIRQHDPDNLMIVGTPSWDQRPNEAIGNEVNDPNVAYSLHFYAGSDWHYFGTGGAGISQNAEAALAAGIPLFVTEWGTTSHDNSSFNEGETRAWMQFLDDNMISSCNWSITAIEEGSAAIRPSASPDGNWSDGDLSESGHLVRSLIRGQ